MKNIKKSNNKNTVILVLLVIIVVLIGVVVYLVFIKKVENNQQVDDKGISTKISGSIDVYCRANYDNCWLTTVSSEGGEIFYKIETETENPIVVEENNDIILFYDNGLKFFARKDKKIRKINLENKYNNYDIVSSRDGNLIGIVYKNEEISGYYDYKTNKTLYDKGKILNDAYNERYILYLNDNKISIYDKQNSKLVKENINLNSNYDDYKAIVEMEVTNEGTGVEKKIIGIFASNEKNKNSTYYNLEKDKTMYQNQYSGMYLEDHNDYLIGIKNLNTGSSYDTIEYVLDPTNEKIVFQSSNTKNHMSLHLEKYDDKYYFIEYTDLVEPHYYTKAYIYSNEKKLIAKVDLYPGDYEGENYIIDNQGNLLVRNNNEIKKYNINGNILNSKIYEKVINITNGYLIVVNNGKLLIEDSNYKQLAEFAEWKDSYQINKYLPVYIIEDSLSEEPRKDFISGVYMVLEDGKNYVEYCFNPKNSEVTSRRIENLDSYDLDIYWSDLS